MVITNMSGEQPFQIPLRSLLMVVYGGTIRHSPAVIISKSVRKYC